MYRNLFVFGDSWGHGSELDLPKEKPFGHWLKLLLNCQHFENASQPGASLGLVVQRLVGYLKNISDKDLVVIVVPPDVRWYDQSSSQGWFPLYLEDPRYATFLQDKTVEWFEYHHALFLYTAQRILEDIGCDYVLTHNYGKMPDLDSYGLKNQTDRFLSNHSLTTLLSGKDIPWNVYQFESDEPPLEVFSGRYFEGKICHPNEEGHKIIAELIFNKINKDCK